MLGGMVVREQAAREQRGSPRLELDRDHDVLPCALRTVLDI